MVMISNLLGGDTGGHGGLSDSRVTVSNNKHLQSCYPVGFLARLFKISTLRVEGLFFNPVNTINASCIF